MTNSQDKMIQLFTKLTVFFNRNTNVIKDVPDLIGTIAAFKIMYYRVIIILQHHEIIKKGIITNLPEIKGALCHLTLEFAEILHNEPSISIEKSQFFEQSLSFDQLLLQEDKTVIEYSLRVYQYAVKFKELLQNKGIGKENVEMLNAAAEMYRTLVSPPRVLAILSEHYENKTIELIKNIEAILQNEIHPLMLQFENLHPKFYNEYTSVRQIL